MSEEACYADDIGDYRWEGVPLAEKHAWMQTGEGAAAVRPAVDALRELSTRLEASDRTLRAKLHELGVTWSGAASTAAASATDRLAEWVGGVGRRTLAGQGNVDTYGSSFATMKSAIPPPVEVDKGTFGFALDGATGGLPALIGLQTDHSRQVAAQQAADQQANAALDAHRDATRHALQTFPVAEAPPDPTAGSAAAALGPPGSAGPAATGATSPTATPPDGRAAAQQPGPSQPPGPSGPAHSSATPADPGAGTSSAAAGSGPTHVPRGGTSPAPSAGPAGSIPVGAIPVGPDGIGPGGRAGPAPAGAAPRGYRPPTIGPGAGIGSGAGTAARAGTGPAPYGESALPPRTGGAPSGGPNTQAAGNAAPRTGPGSGVHGAPMGMGGAPGGAERYHRNQTFIPSDEPFHVEFADISPPVLGVRGEDEP